jgi:excisionase family DNA binding protein
MHKESPSQYIGAAEVCRILGIDRSTLSRWVKEGRLVPAMKLPGLRGPFLFNRTDFPVDTEVAS